MRTDSPDRADATTRGRPGIALALIVPAALAAALSTSTRLRS